MTGTVAKRMNRSSDGFGQMTERSAKQTSAAGVATPGAPPDGEATVMPSAAATGSASCSAVFDFCSFLSAAPGIEVFRSPFGKFMLFQLVIKLFTKLAQSSGPENISPERPLPNLLAPEPVLSPSRITPENNGKIRPQPDRENAFARASGGERGIRTLETVPRLHTFQACAFDHSATCSVRASAKGTCRCKGSGVGGPVSRSGSLHRDLWATAIFRLSAPRRASGRRPSRGRCSRRKPRISSPSASIRYLT